jgi:hypothetical protein
MSLHDVIEQFLLIVIRGRLPLNLVAASCVTVIGLHLMSLL